MNEHTTADYLNQLEQDRQDLVDNLETQGITGLSGDETFTELVPEVLNIETGGGDISEYFEADPSSITITSYVSWLADNFIKKTPNINIPSSATNLSYFAYGWNLTKVPKIIAGSNITNMSNMFNSCRSEDVDLSGLNFTNVTTLDTFLRGCYLKYLDLSNISFSAVRNTQYAFATSPSTSVHDSYVKLENSEFPLLTSALNMFAYGKAFNISLKNADLSSVTTFNYMFAYYGYNEQNTYYIIDFTGCDVSSLTNLSNMFNSCYVYKMKILGLDTSNVTTMYNMFSNASNLREVIMENFNTKKVTTMSNCFSGCFKYLPSSGLCSLDLSSWETDELTNTSGMFNNCTKLGHIDMRKFDFTNVTNYSNMFGASASNGVPDDCEIIVKDNDAKTWIQTNFSRLTNVKTVAELS